MVEDEKPSESTLPEPVRDHLGHELRTIYTVSGGQPQYLGDDTEVPEAFAPQIRRLETRLKTHEEGTGAVEQVVDKILDVFGVPPEGAEAGEGAEERAGERARRPTDLPG